MRLDSSSCKHCCLWSFNHGFPRDRGSGKVRRFGKKSYRCCRSPKFPCDCDVVHAKFPAGSLGKVLRGMFLVRVKIAADVLEVQVLPCG